MANRSVGVGRKERKTKQKVYQDRSNAYRPDGLTYNTGDDTLKKTKGIDKGTLQSTTKEHRGRKKADAPIGKRVQHTKTETQKVRSRRKNNKKRGK